MKGWCTQYMKAQNLCGVVVQNVPEIEEAEVPQQ